MADGESKFEVVASGFGFVEAPRVDEDGTVYFSDLLGASAYKRTSDGVVKMLFADRKWVGGSVLNRDSSVIFSGQGGLIAYDEKTGIKRKLLTHVAGRAIDAINDIEADNFGSLYGGTIDFTQILEKGGTPEPGVLFRLDPSGTLTVLREGVFASNGIGFSPDRTLLYHSETSVGIWAYDLGADRSLRNQRLFAKLDDSDGLVVDAEGGVWVARFQAGEIVRFKPDAAIDRRIRLPWPALVSLCFGGKDLTDLYVTTGGAKPEDRQGAVVRIRSDIPGQASMRANL